MAFKQTDHLTCFFFKKTDSAGEEKVYYCVEMPEIEPGAFHMRSERSTTELHPLPMI